MVLVKGKIDNHNDFMYCWLFAIVPLITSLCLVHGLKEIDDGDENIGRSDVLKVFERFARTRENSPPFANRRSDSSRTAKVRSILEVLKNAADFDNIQGILRQTDNLPEEGGANEHEEEDANNMISKDALDKLVEKELQSALAQRSSALLDRPYIQKTGRNDFLVMRPEISDPFVTVIPNDIYYMKEKKCVNWLEDCNAEGIRARLLQKVMYP